MSISTETIETALSGMVPRALNGNLPLTLAAEMDAFSESAHHLSPAQSAVEARLRLGVPQPLHPQQAETFESAQRDGITESEWAQKFQPSPLSFTKGQEVVNQMDASRPLSQITPASLNPALFEDLISKMDAVSGGETSESVGAPDEGKVLAFPGRPLPQTSKSSPLIKVAAAVAVVGAVLGVLLPGFQEATPNQFVATPVESPASDAPNLDSNLEAVPSLPAFASLMSPQLVPASLESGVRSPQDQGLVLDGQNQAHRQFEFEQVERMILIDEQGRQREFERPRGKRRCTVPVETH